VVDLVNHDQLGYFAWKPRRNNVFPAPTDLSFSKALPLGRTTQSQPHLNPHQLEISSNRSSDADKSIANLSKMGRPKRNVFATAEETSTPPSSLTTTQAIARVIKAEGNCLYSCTLPEKKTILVELPSRFRNTIWIKRGGYVLIDTKEADVRQNRIDGEIINVVRDEHLWRKEAYW
jgi:probable RNA-binding protein EIF1AD